MQQLVSVARGHVRCGAGGVVHRTARRVYFDTVLNNKRICHSYGRCVVSVGDRESTAHISAHLANL